MMDTGFYLTVAGLIIAQIGVLIKLAMDYQKTKSHIEALENKMSDHIARNDDEHKKLFALEEKLQALHVDVKIIIDRLTRRKDDTHEAQ